VEAFLRHHCRSVRFVYSCFDRILFNLIVPAWQCAAVLVGLLTKRRAVPAITRAYLRKVSDDYQKFVEAFAGRRIPLVVPPQDVRRDEWVEPFYRRLRGRPGVAAILKSREAARIAVSYETRTGGHHIELYRRFVNQFYFYILDQEFGRLFFRICPYLPFNGRMLVNGHEWLACQMRKQGIRFRQHGNAFTACSDPQRLQELADAFSTRDVIGCAQRWLPHIAPPLMTTADGHGARDYRLFFSQTEYCTNIVFDRRAPLDRMAGRLLDLNRNIGRPDKLTVIFGRRIDRRARGGFKTQITDHHLGNPVIRSHYKDQSVKQYVRDHLLLRTETTCYNPPELGVPKALENLPKLRHTLHGINGRYLDVQQDVMETFLDRGQMRQLAQPTVSAGGRRTPGIRPDDPRLLALMHSLTRFANIAGNDSFRTRDLLPAVREFLGRPDYTLDQLRYDLAKLRAKGLVVRIEKSHRYRTTPEGFRICVLFLKLAERVYQPLVAGLWQPVAEDRHLEPDRRCELDRRYAAVDAALDDLLSHIGLKAA
jgi:hypothetical protein